MHTYIDTTINILLSMYRYAYYLSQYLTNSSKVLKAKIDRVISFCPKCLHECTNIK